MNIIAIFPAFNAASTLPELLAKVKEFIPDILVVDDGSDDKTADAANMAGVNIIRLERNFGKGVALKRGFAYMIQNGFDLALTLDSDGQHDPKYIPDFLGAQKRTGADLIIGSRISSRADMPLDRRFSNWTTSHLISFLLNTHIEDVQCGYRLYSKKLIERIELVSDKFELETEIIIKAVKAGFKPEFIPIEVVYGTEFPTHINRFKDTLRWCRRVWEFI
jgi:glycosyltransferase involved in cell wall biosynthesis